jgi:hypothetical protein
LLGALSGVGFYLESSAVAAGFSDGIGAMDST